ncbi:MAG: signal protein [Verrucomicrobia bacterium]|nr:MAG: signal protein [Verrucomicrobiota bacterium]
MKHARTKTAASPTASPSPAKPKLGDLFKPKSSAAASPANRSPAPARGATAEEAVNPPAPGGGHGLVWVNTETHVYHREGSHFYGTTKKGKYMTEADAVKEGNRAAAARR